MMLSAMQADDARQRALREMMNATLEIKKKEKNDNVRVTPLQYLNNTSCTVPAA
jgi:hypothetical protein